MTQSVRRRSVDLSVIFSKKGSKLHFPAPIGALVYFLGSIILCPIGMISQANIFVPVFRITGNSHENFEIRVQPCLLHTNSTFIILFSA